MTVQCFQAIGFKYQPEPCAPTARSLPISGLKAALVERLREALAGEGEAAEAEAAPARDAEEEGVVAEEEVVEEEEESEGDSDDSDDDSEEEEEDSDEVGRCKLHPSLKSLKAPPAFNH